MDEDKTFKHCDEYIEDCFAPEVLRWFLLVERLPAISKMLAYKYIPKPMLFADYEGKRVRVTMASRFGDLGITEDGQSTSYDLRVAVTSLSNFDNKA